MADPKLITTEQLSQIQAREIEFVQMFHENIEKLIEVLGITRLIPITANSVLKTYEAVGSLQGGAVAEGETIPLSQYELEERTYKNATLRKYRKATTAEAILSRGYEYAVEKTTDKMLLQTQKEIKSDFFTFLKSGVGRTHGTTLQAALAQAMGQVKVFFEDYDVVEPIYFLNPLDVADYLSTAQITTQTLFGMTYIQNFLGLGDVLTNSSVTKGTVIATAKGNLLGSYIPVNGPDIGEAFTFTTDETGYIGIHETPDYTNMTASDTVICGIDFFAEYIDGVIVSKIGNTDVEAHKYTADELNQMTLYDIKALAKSKSYSITKTTKAECITEFLAAQK